MADMGVLSRIPGLAGYLAGQQQDQQMQTGQLQQMGALQGILAQQQKQQMVQQEMQEQQAVKGLVAQAGGDPAKVVERLLASGNPRAIELATKMKSLMPKPAKPFTLSPGAQRYGADGTVIAEAPMREPAVRAPQSRTVQVGTEKVTQEYDPATGWKEVGRGPAFAKQVAGQGGGTAFGATQGSLDPVKDQAELRDLAIQSLYDPGSLAGYRRDTKVMGHIQRERIKVMREAGVTSEDVVSGRAGFKADTASLNKITPQYDAITAFEKTAIRNGKILIELADKVDTTGVPVAERWIRSGRKAIGGDPDVAKFDAQMNLYRAEAARILTQPNLSGVLTDTARKEMEDVIRNSASAEQIRGVVNLLERDFNNRKETLEEQIGAIRGRMRGRVAPGGGATETPATTAAAPAAAAGALTPQEKQELDTLRKRFGR